MEEGRRRRKKKTREGDREKKRERKREDKVQETGRKEVPTRSGPRSRRLPGLEPAQC